MTRKSSLTKDNPLPFPKPRVYDEEQYELLARLFESGADPRMRWSLDTNNHHLFDGAYFIDFVGGNYNWPNANWIERERLFQDHANYQIGVMYFLANSNRIPEPYRTEIRRWGLPRDEYIGTGGWSHQLYIREGRRMISDYVMTQHNCQGREVPTDSVGLASYNMDSHHCQMTVIDGAVRNEGNVEIRVEPYLSSDTQGMDNIVDDPTQRNTVFGMEQILDAWIMTSGDRGAMPAVATEPSLSEIQAAKRAGYQRTWMKRLGKSKPTDDERVRWWEQSYGLHH